MLALSLSVLVKWRKSTPLLTKIPFFSFLGTKHAGWVPTISSLQGLKYELDFEVLLLSFSLYCLNLTFFLFLHILSPISVSVSVSLTLFSSGNAFSFLCFLLFYFLILRIRFDQLCLSAFLIPWPCSYAFCVRLHPSAHYSPCLETSDLSSSHWFLRK